MSFLNRKNKFIETYSLLLGDLIISVGAFLAAVLIRIALSNHILAWDPIYPSCILYILVLSLSYSMFMDGNRNFFSRGYYIEFVAIIKYTAYLLLGLLAILYFTGEIKVFSRLVFAVFAMTHIGFLYCARIMFKNYMLGHYRKGENSSKVMVITTSDRLQDILHTLCYSKVWNFQVTSAALMDQGGQLIREKDDGESETIPIVANAENLYEVARQMPLDEVFISLPNYNVWELKAIIMNFQSMGIECHYHVDFIDVEHSESVVENFGGYGVVSYSVRYFDYRRLVIKRLIDVMGSLIGLLITAFIAPFVALAIKLESPGPVFFSQTRIGKNGRRFQIYKFRSMYLDAEKRKKDLLAENQMQGLMFKIEDDPRITKVGRFIRKTSIDELPQFYNVLIGQMSLVGTRPPTEDEFEQYNLYYRRRMSITPGLTGMWQANGRSKVKDFDDVVKYDLEYIDHWSLGLDMKLILKTIVDVLFGHGAE